MTLVEVRTELEQIAARLVVLAAETKRRSPVKRAPIRSARVTPKLAADVRRFARAHPHWSNAQIGRVFNIDGGRVSEILAGKRK